jgi:hypothetical protein
MSTKAPNGLEMSRPASPRIHSNARPNTGLARSVERSLERSVRGSIEVLGGTDQSGGVSPSVAVWAE